MFLTDVNCRKLIESINNGTKKKTSIQILEDFKGEDLHEPDFAVFPQIIRFDSGDHLRRRDFGRDDDVEFDHQRQYKNKAIKIKDFMASMWRKQESEPGNAVDITAIIASAGAGKTTLIRRMAQNALNATFEDQPKMVHYVELKDIQVGNFIKTSKFLFGGVYNNESEEDLAFQWLVENQTDVVLIFDGFDQTTWSFDDDSLRKIENDEITSPSTIMHNILARNILRHVKIFIASREFKVLELPEKARPKNIIALNGLTLQDARRIFIFLLGEKGEELWEIIETMSVRLLQPISVPVFLILTAVVMGRDPNRDPPTTVTDLYNRIVSNLQSVRNLRNRKNILLIINLLKSAAFRAIEKQMKVDEWCLKDKFEVFAAEAQDLMTKVPSLDGSKEGDLIFHFCPQSIEKFLAASFLSKTEFHKFTKFYEEHLHNSQWRDVRQFVAGIVYSESSDNLHRGKHCSRRRIDIASCESLEI